ncbi:MAG: type VI secretion system protein TssA [Pseudomonadota bacterium]
MLDAESLLRPRSDEAPSGDNLEYDTRFTDLELAAQPGEERQEGDTIIPAEDPEWGEVAKKAEEVLDASHEIRAAVLYAQATLHTEGLRGLEVMSEYIRGVLEDHWETCHPQLDEDDGDATMRVNAVQGLAGSDQVVRALRKAPLTNSRMFGTLSLRDMEIADGTISAPASEDVIDASAVGAALQDTDAEELEATMASALRIREHVRAIEDVFNENTPGYGPTLDLLDKTVASIVKRLSDVVGGEVADIEGDDAGDGSAAAGPAGGGAPLSGAINSQADVTKALDKIISYYQRTEPSSPVPILLERAKKLVGADFMTIINDMAPSGLENVNIIGGLEEDDD